MGINVANVCSGYDTPVLHDVNLNIARGALTVLIGPNGCGKSTLLKTIGRIVKPTSGRITIDGQDVTTTKGRTVARTIAYLPQSPAVPAAVTVEELVGYGRAPHQSILGLHSKADREIVDEAIAATGIGALRKRRVSDLSGGQKQRAFIAMALAQDTPFIMLDEPTTFLDIRHQFETLDLIATLNAAGKTAVVVLHDIAQAARYGHHLVVMREGRIHASGRPGSIVTPQMVQDVYGLDCNVYPDPMTGTPVVTPQPRMSLEPDRILAAQ